MSDYPHGRFGWHELMTSDTAAAARFYSGLTNWTSAPAPQDPSYTMWMNGGTPIAGLMSLTSPMRMQHVPPNWLTYILVQDLAAAAEKAQGMGATVIVTESVEGVGSFSVVQDPQGAVFGMLQQITPGGHDGAPQVGEFSWNELATTDWHGGWNFYHALFGWDPSDEMDMGPLGIYKIFARNGVQLGAIYNKPPAMRAPPHWLPYIKVGSVDRVLDQVPARGGTVLAGPMEVPGEGRIAQCLDPQGAAFALHSVAVAALPTRKPVFELASPKKIKTIKKAAKKSVKKVLKKTAKEPTKRPVKKSVKRVKRR